MKTIAAKSNHLNLKWCVVDAEHQVLGRLATQIAMRLRGKHLPHFTPHAAMGDGVIVINAEKINATGKKMKNKFYYHHSGYQGGMTAVSLEKMLQTYPERVITHAVRGMLPKNKLGRELLTRLRVYKGTDHPHIAQQPQAVSLTSTN